MMISAIEDSDRVEERRKFAPPTLKTRQNTQEYMNTSLGLQAKFCGCTYELHTPCRADMPDDEPGNYNVS